MRKKAKKQIIGKRSQLMIVNPHAAGIDISSTEHQVCVPEDRCKDYNRRFGSFTSDLHLIVKWLRECKIKTVAMESTGIYWVQLFLLLQEFGFDVILVNARHIKNIGEKKTDIVDAHWIMLLHSYGLLKPSYQPDLHTRDLREYMRQRDALIKSASREVLHIQKALEQMNIKVHKVIRDITGKTGMAIVGAILNGERDPVKLAELADKRIEATKEEMIMSLEGIWQSSQLFILQQSHDLYFTFKSRIEQCDRKIEEHLSALQPVLKPEVNSTEPEDQKKKIPDLRKKEVKKINYPSMPINN